MKEKGGSNKEIRVLTGDRPTGRLHLGHYVGSIQNRLKLQDEHDHVYYMVADVQALTDNADNPEKVRDNVREVILDSLACGIDPEKTTIFIQSMIPQIAELTVFFLNLVTVSRLKRNPTVKNEINQKGYGEAIPAGFLMYPVSQAADILFLRSNLIPVGEDQLPMIEQTNEIADTFNRYYGKVFDHVKAVIGNHGRLPGIDGNAKMSKSLGNGIFLSDDRKTLEKKVMQMYTDPNHIRVEDPGEVKGNVVFTYLDIFDPNTDEVAELKKQYKKGGLGDVVLKKRLIDVLDTLLAPIREKRAYYESHPDIVDRIIENGTTKVQKQAQDFMVEVKEKMKINYF
jgi:tryptophanyl-tRNA synthetase